MLLPSLLPPAPKDKHLFVVKTTLTCFQMIENQLQKVILYQNKYQDGKNKLKLYGKNIWVYAHSSVISYLPVHLRRRR